MTENSTLIDYYLTLESRADLSALLGIKNRDLCYILYGEFGHQRDRHYDVFEIKKRNGGYRQIEAPNRGLKYIQSLLKSVLENMYLSKKCVHGYSFGKSIVTNAYRHKNKRYVLNIDLVDFFPSITSGRVYGMLRGNPYNLSEEVAATITQIVSYSGRLPQGGPCSPVISNMICGKLDDQLKNLAIKNRCVYTRYADDITVSTNKKEFPQYIIENNGQIVSCSGKIVDTINSNGFDVNINKTRLQKYNQRQDVTGLTVNRFPNVRRSYINKIRAMIHACKKFGVEDAGKHHYLKYYDKNSDNTKFDFLGLIKGKIDFVGMVRGRDNDIYRKLLNMYLDIPGSYGKKRDYIAIASGIDENRNYIFTEGCTDWRHVSAALSYFRSIGEYTDLDIDYYKYGVSEPSGATSQIKRCDALYPNHKGKGKRFFIFDNDDSAACRYVGGSGQRFLGNNCYAILLPVPQHRIDEDKICIEMLYQDKDLLRLDSEGRRIYYNYEFRVDDGFHHDLDTLEYGFDLKKAKKVRGWNTVVKSPSPKIIDSKVADHSVFPPRSAALAKYDFAQNIMANVPEFRNMDFSGFRPLLDVIDELLKK